MAPFSVIVFGVAVLTIAVSGAKQLRFRLKTDKCGQGLTLPQMKQIYYSLIYPKIAYAILAWGSAYKTHIDKIQTKQNHSARLIFFVTAYGEHTESALPC